MLVVATLSQDNAALAASRAYNQGYWNARNAVMNHWNFNDHCGFEHSESYCFDYKLGYNVGWNAASLLH